MIPEKIQSFIPPRQNFHKPYEYDKKLSNPIANALTKAFNIENYVQHTTKNNNGFSSCCFCFCCYFFHANQQSSLKVHVCLFLQRNSLFLYTHTHTYTIIFLIEKFRSVDMDEKKKIKAFQLNFFSIFFHCHFQWKLTGWCVSGNKIKIKIMSIIEIFVVLHFSSLWLNFFKNKNWMENS